MKTIFALLLLANTVYGICTWNVTPTGENHQIIIINNIVGDVNGSPLAPGDCIGVFYQNGNNLTCGGYTEWNGSVTSLTAYMEDVLTLGQNGFEVGETFKWKVRQASTGQIFNAEVTYEPIGSGNGVISHQGEFAIDGISAINSITTYTEQYIQVNTGWQWISTNVVPESLNIDDVLEDIETIILKAKRDTDIYVYFPYWDVNEIGDYDPYIGYWLKVSNPGTISIRGTKIPSGTPIPIDTGWQLVPYYPTNLLFANTAFQSINTITEIVKDDEGQVYIPSLGLNTIGAVKPGKAYAIKSRTIGLLIYPQF